MTVVPAWIQILQALLTPAIALAVCAIGFLQWRTAHKKVVLDLFDRRWRVYQAVVDVARAAMSDGGASERIVQLGQLINEGSFLFGNDIIEQMKGLQRALSKLAMADVVIRNTDHPEHRYWVNAKHEKSMEILSFLDTFPQSCSRYMRMSEKQIRTPLEWLRDRKQNRSSALQ